MTSLATKKKLRTKKIKYVPFFFYKCIGYVLTISLLNAIKINNGNIHHEEQANVCFLKKTNVLIL